MNMLVDWFLQQNLKQKAPLVAVDLPLPENSSGLL